MSTLDRKQRRPIIQTLVEHPLDPFFPFGQNLYEDERVVYHGTWSAYSPLIEKQGMGRKCLAYEQIDIETLCDICERFGVTGDVLPSHLVLQAWSIGFAAGQRPIWLAKNYWLAREYAGRRGGETVYHSMLTIAYLELFLGDRDMRQAHTRRLQERISGLGTKGTKDSQVQVANSDNVRVLRDAGRELADIAGRLRSLAEFGHPVVYAIKAAPDWDDWQNGALVVPWVPVHRFRARVDFANGVESVYIDDGMPLPLRWALRPYLDHLKKRMRDGIFSDHQRFLEQTNEPIVKAAFQEVFG